MNTASSTHQTREQRAAADITEKINRCPITRQAVEQILANHQISISNEMTRGEITRALINIGNPSPDRHAVIMYINGEEKALPTIADAIRREDSGILRIAGADDQERRMLHTDTAKTEVELGIRQSEVSFDSEHPDIGECVVSFRNWMDNVFENVRRKSFPPRLRHKRFMVPQRFRHTIAAPDHVETDETGMFFYKGMPIVVF